MTLISGIITAVLLSYIIFLRYRESFLRKQLQQFQSSFEARVNPVDTMYQELDLSKMNNEDNYQSLKKNNEFGYKDVEDKINYVIPL